MTRVILVLVVLLAMCQQNPAIAAEQFYSNVGALPWFAAGKNSAADPKSDFWVTPVTFHNAGLTPAACGLHLANTNGGNAWVLANDNGDPTPQPGVVYGSTTIIVYPGQTRRVQLLSAPDGTFVAGQLFAGCGSNNTPTVNLMTITYAHALYGYDGSLKTESPATLVLTSPVGGESLDATGFPTNLPRLNTFSVQCHVGRRTGMGSAVNMDYCGVAVAGVCQQATCPNGVAVQVTPLDKAGVPVASAHTISLSAPQNNIALAGTTAIVVNPDVFGLSSFPREVESVKVEAPGLASDGKQFSIRVLGFQITESRSDGTQVAGAPVVYTTSAAAPVTAIQ